MGLRQTLEAKHIELEEAYKGFHQAHRGAREDGPLGIEGTSLFTQFLVVKEVLGALDRHRDQAQGILTRAERELKLKPGHEDFEAHAAAARAMIALLDMIEGAHA